MQNLRPTLTNESVSAFDEDPLGLYAHESLGGLAQPRPFEGELG